METMQQLNIIMVTYYGVSYLNNTLHYPLRYYKFTNLLDLQMKRREITNGKESTLIEKM